MTTPVDYFFGVIRTFGEVRRWVGFWGPVIDLPVASLNPLVTIGALLALVISTGMALTAISLLLVSLLALHLLLTQVFGLSLEFSI